MDRFKMSFKNSGEFHQLYNSNLAPPSVPASVKPRNIGLNAPMIDRVHKAKPGCSACGKKVS
jgi:hypothetical protein